MKNSKLFLLGFVVLLLAIFWPKQNAEIRMSTSYDPGVEKTVLTDDLVAESDSVTVSVLDRFGEIEKLISQTKDEIQAQQQRIKQLENELIASQKELEQQRMWLDREKASQQLFHRLCWAVLIVGIIFFLLALWMVISRKKKEAGPSAEFLEKKTVKSAEEPATKDMD